MWATMAAARAKTHPHDAIALYHRLLPIAAESGTRNARYEEAFGIVRTIGKLRAELKEHTEFADELESIRQTYRAKRNFIKLLAAPGWVGQGRILSLRRDCYRFRRGLERSNNNLRQSPTLSRHVS
jgi:hypothetical protein